MEGEGEREVWEEGGEGQIAALFLMSREPDREENDLFFPPFFARGALISMTIATIR